MKRIILFTLSILMLFACGVNETAYNKVVSQRDSLKLLVSSLERKIDILENDEERLMNFIELYSRNKDYLKACDYIDKLKKNHPESQLLFKHSRKFIFIENKAKIIRDSIDKAVRDSIKLANINDLGIWRIGNYVDDFGQPTGNHFVYANCLGSFSNRATSRGNLGVEVTFTSNQTAVFKYDRYGTNKYYYEDASVVRMVSKVLHKSYHSDDGWDDLYDPNTYKRYRIENILREESIYEVEMRMQSDEKYFFTIDTKGLNNALVKAKLLSIDEL